MEQNQTAMREEYKKTVERVRGAMPDKELMNDLSELFKICGDSTRVGIICALVGAEMCVGDIADILGMTSSAISHQLRVLKHLEIVKSRREGRNILYHLADRQIGEIFRLGFAHLRQKHK